MKWSFLSLLHNELEEFANLAMKCKPHFVFLNISQDFVKMNKHSLFLRELGYKIQFWFE